jgi:DNA-binding PadR family transcriptional regulator
LERAGLIASAWGASDNNRRARFYRLTRTGRSKLSRETGKWAKIMRAVQGVLSARPEEEEA